MLTECPHCLSEVLPDADGRCPSCRGDTTDESASDWGKVRVRVGDTLPSICCTCGEPTRSVERVGVETRDGAPGWVRLLAFLWKPTLLLRPDLEANQTLFDIEMPRCEECQKDEPLVPEHVDEAHHRMTFVVVRDFKERLDRSRGG